jgi:hypothetical protein
MGDNAGGGTFRMCPISYQCVGVWISKGFRLKYKRVDRSSHETANCRNPPINTFTGDGKKRDLSILDQHLSMSYFSEIVRTSISLWT